MGFSLREAFHWIPGEILTILVFSKPRFDHSGSKTIIFGDKLGCAAPALPCRGSCFSKYCFVHYFCCFFKVLKSCDSEPGTPLERSGSKFCAKSRPWELRSIYGEPFREDFVPIGVGQRSGASSFTFSLVPGPRSQIPGTWYQVPGTWFQAGLGPRIIRNDSGMIPELSPAERVRASSSDPTLSARGQG